MAKNKILLIMPGEIGFYLRDKLPSFIVNRPATQRLLRLLFLRKVPIPLQFLAIAPYLRQAGFDVVIIDGRVEDARERITAELDDRVVYVGITALTGGMIAYGVYCAEVVRDLNPKVPIVWGGVHVTLTPEQTLATSDLVDFVVRGEGELTAVELAQALASGGDVSCIQGVSWRSPQGIVHNPDRPFMDFGAQLPLDYSLIDQSKYDTDSILYQSERGCPHRCAFCDVVIVHRRKFRQKSAEQVVADLKHIYDTFHPKKFHFVDDCFFADLKRANAIIDGLIALRWDAHWHASCRVQYTKRLTREFWERARESGLSEVYVGAESASQEILDYIKKDCTVDDIHATAEQICGAGILMWTNFMSGFPIETREHTGETVDLIDYLDEKYKGKMLIGKIFLYAPCPGTPLHFDVVKAGFVPPATLRAWGNFRIGDISHTRWHKDAEYMASASLCSQYGRNLAMETVTGKLQRGFRRYDFATFAKLLVLKFPEFVRVLLRPRAAEKWRTRDFRFTWDVKVLRWINLTFDNY